MPSSNTTSNAGLGGGPFPRGSALTWLFLYRLLLVMLLMLAYWFAKETPWLASAGDPSAARFILGTQAALILTSGLLIPAGWPTPERQIEIAVFLDIVVYTLLMHISGGIVTGLGLLLAIAVIAGAILLEGRLSLLFASLATLAVITQHVYLGLDTDAQSGTYAQAGLLGLTYFAVALLAHVLGSRLRATERLAERHEVDIADLAKLNDHVIQSLSTGVLVVDANHVLLLLNNAARRLLDIPHARTGDPLLRLAPALREWLTRELGGRNPAESRLRIGHAEVLPSLHPIRLKRATGAMIYLRDNRDLLRQAQEMKLASLGRLTASIAHNIRNPLSAVTHSAQLLAESDGLGDDDRHLLGILRRNALRIEETVASVLELSRRHEPDIRELELGHWLAAFCEEYRENHGRAAGWLGLEVAAGPLLVHADPRHVGQILCNLLDNAYTHGARAGAAAGVALNAARDAVRDAVILTVADDGPGIATEHVRDIFEPFFTTSRGGTGLGLYTARELAEANSIRLAYSPGGTAGACFSLTFGR